MALNNFDASIVGRSANCKSHNAIKKAAYNAREKLKDERTGETWDYSRKDGLLHHEIFLPENAPEWMRDREKLHNAIEAKEDQGTRPDKAQLVHSWIVSLPHELTNDQRKEMVNQFAREITQTGRVVDVAIHAPDLASDERNYHAHVLVTMRHVTPEGEFGDKMRAPDSKRDDEKNNFRNWAKQELANWKDRYSEIGATRLHEAGFEIEAERFIVGHWKLKEQLQDAHRRKDWEWVKHLDGREPGRHMGPGATAMERDDVNTHLGETNRKIDELNQRRKEAVERVPEGLNEVSREIWLAKQTADNAQEFLAGLRRQDIELTRLTKEDVQKLVNEKFAQDRYIPQYREGEYVAVTEYGHIYRLTRFNTGANQKQLDAFLKPIENEKLDSLDHLRKLGAERWAENRARHIAHLTDPELLKANRRNIWEAFEQRTSPYALQIDLEKRGLTIARVSAEEAEFSKTQSSLDERFHNKYSPVYRPGEYVIVDQRCHVHRLYDKTTGLAIHQIEAFLKPMDRDVHIPSMRQAISRIEREAEQRDWNPRKAPAGRAAILMVPASARMAGKTLDMVAAGIEGTLAPILTPKQKREGRVADVRKEIAAEREEDRRRAEAEQAQRQQNWGRDRER